MPEDVRRHKKNLNIMETEKVYCQGTDPAVYAMMNNNNMNPMWLVWLLAMRWMNGGNGEIESLRGQIADNKNSSDMLMALQSNASAMQDIATRTNTSIDFVRQSLCSLDKSLAKLGGDIGISGERVINSVVLGNKDLTAALQACCCENKLLVQQMGYEGQLRDASNTAALSNRIDGVINALQNGFSNIGYATAQQTCDLKNEMKDGVQRIVDILNVHWSQEKDLALQDTKFKLSQMEQNQYLLAQLKNNCGCGCN